MIGLPGIIDPEFGRIEETILLAGGEAPGRGQLTPSEAGTGRSPSYLPLNHGTCRSPG